MDKKQLKLSRLDEILAGTAIGVVSFPLALGIVQNFVFKPLRITCKSPIGVVLVCGSSSVVASGLLASYAFLASSAVLQQSRAPVSEQSSVGFKLDLDVSKGSMALCGLGSLLVFTCFGGRVRHVIPSHLFYPGAFARMALPATGKSYASSSLKKTLNALGRKYGCHSCGRRRHKDFVADHMPPNKLVKFYQSQVFYPQCKTCSQKQGGALSSNSKLNAIQTHATTLRWYHIWLPIPLAIAAVKNILESERSDAEEE